MSFYSNIRQAIQDGLDGKNKGVSIGHTRMDRYVNIRRKLYYMLMGSSGSGKSSFLYDAFILNPLENLASSGDTKTKLKYLLFMMERSKTYIQAKWLIRRIFLDTGRLIPMYKLLKWGHDKLSDEELKLIEDYEEYMNFLQEHIEIYEGARSPGDIYRIVKGYSEDNGKYDKVNEHKEIYTPTNESELVVVAIDHLGLTKTTKELGTKKQAIDKLSEYLQHFRDHMGYSVIGVNQLNRDLSSPLFAKLDSFEPHLDNAKETGNTIEASDVVISLFDPLRYNTNDKFYGDVSKFRDSDTGHKYFRNVKILKNTYGVDDIGVGMVFEGVSGIFKELPKSSETREWDSTDYENLFSNRYFLNQ